MNKKELFEAVIELPVDCSSSRPKIDKLTTLELIKLLDEPEKVTIPQFVADYIEFQKKNNFHVYGSMRVIEDHYDKNVPEWFYEKNIETFARAWLDGYEVEEEKQYYIRLKGVDENYNYLNHIKHLDAWCLTEIKKDKKFRTTHTRKQLEDAGFGEVFNSTLFEVEEVE